MIIQNETLPTEVSLNTMESKKYLVVKNHVREIYEAKPSNCENGTETSETSKESSKKRKKKASPSNEKCVVRNDTSEISQSDLEELKRIYKKCKSVLLKIESKYGHLLDFDEDICTTRKRRHNSDTEKQCKCALNSRVLFTDDGNLLQTVESPYHHHICPDRLPAFKRYQPTENVEIESESFVVPLPNTIQELQCMLKDPLTSILRQRVIDKIKFMRQVNLNMIRFDKQNLIEKVKANPDEVVDFKGTNFSSIVGYPSNPT